MPRRKKGKGRKKGKKGAEESSQAQDKALPDKSESVKALAADAQHSNCDLPPTPGASGSSSKGPGKSPDAMEGDDENGNTSSRKLKTMSASYSRLAKFDTSLDQMAESSKKTLEETMRQISGMQARKLYQRNQRKQRKQKNVWRSARIIINALMVLSLIPVGYYMYKIQNRPKGASKSSREAGEFPLKAVDLDAKALYDTVMYPTSDWASGASNDDEVVWAVFFHKPYCGACRRVMPLFKALGASVKAGHRLRFATFDCVRYRTICARLDIETHPRIRLYKAVVSADSTKDVKNARKHVAEWQGMLIAYDIVDWFKAQQPAGHIAEEVEWPENDALAKKMLEFKQKIGITDDAVSTRHRNDPAGYLVAAEAAMHMGFLDHVFVNSKDDLTGERLAVLRDWIAALARTFPRADMRSRLDGLGRRIGRRDRWTQEAYEAAIHNWKKQPSENATMSAAAAAGGGDNAERNAVVETSGNDDDDSEDIWGSWCPMVGPGVGGYTCGLWVLFHTVLANSDRGTSVSNLRAIAAWVDTFFGCEHCAQHFGETWERLEGMAVTEPMHATVWLWQAHNIVNERLSGDDTTAPHPQFPSVEDCELCYQKDVRADVAAAAAAADDNARNGEGEGQTREMRDDDDDASQRWDAAQWELQTVFMFLQEQYCFRSDTIACASFYDPSLDAALQKMAQIQPGGGSGWRNAIIWTLLVAVATAWWYNLFPGLPITASC